MKIQKEIEDKKFYDSLPKGPKGFENRKEPVKKPRPPTSKELDEAWDDFMLIIQKEKEKKRMIEHKKLKKN